MPVSNDKKRKLEKGGKATPAKKAKVATPAKKTSTPNTKKAAASKVTASKVKKTPQKVTKPAKPASKAKPVAKKATAAVKSRPAAKQNGKKEAEKKGAKTKPTQNVKTVAKSTVTRGKLDSAVKSKTQSAASKAKAKAVKNLAKPTLQKGKKPEIKKAKVAPSKQKLEKPKAVTKKKAEESKPKEDSKKKAESSAPAKKRKASDSKDEASDESPRKRRVITPNKKYADFEVNVSPKRVSELRAFIQDKRKSTDDEPPVKPTKTPGKESPKPQVKKATPKPKKVESDDDDEDIKIIKPSEMKPAEKLLKKLQKKLEKEAKAASSFKPQSEVKDKTKITKIVTYNKPKTKISTIPIKSLAQTPKLPKTPKVSTGVLKSASKDTPKNKVKTVKVTPKVSQTPEKIVKPKKIKEIKREERPIQVKFAYQKNIKQKDDQNCWITGIDIFPSGEIIMVDMASKKIKLFNKDIDECLSSVKLDTIPQDISVSPVDASSAYFTKPFSKEGIQKISMSDGKLTLKESFFTNGTNRGIKCTKTGILTSVQDGRYHDLDINCFKIDQLDYEGKRLKTVSMDLSGNRLFKLPLYFTTSHNDKQVIVSDCIRQNSYIVSLDLTGQIKFKYTGMLAPRGLTVDNHDNVYVTEWEQNNVYVLSPTGKRLQVLMTDQECQDDGLDGLAKPYQLCFLANDKDGQLIVSQEGKTTVKVFNISRLSEKSEAAQKEEKAEAQSPQKAAESPKKSVETPKKSVETPKKSVETPKKPVESPKKAEKPEEIPDNKDVEMPQLEAVEAAVETVEASTANTDTKDNADTVAS